MNCVEFQKALPYIIETGGNAAEEEHLRGCPVCSDLVQDLKYIAEQAKLLVPMEDPSPQVWLGIREALEREGLVRKPPRGRGRFLGHTSVMPWLAAAAAAIVIIAGFSMLRSGPVAPEETATLQAAVSPEDQQDEQLLAQVAQSRPEMKEAYATNLKQVNTSIKESKKALEDDPSDDDARSALLRAYEQRAMVYDMATRSLQ